jgi:hypothetical protein
VIERGQQAGFACEASPPFGIGREMRRQDLECDIAPQVAVVRAIDLTHAAGPERRDDRVWPESTADHLTVA